MDPQQEGIVNTCFLTVRLPQWAGSRQNVVGSDIEGRPVTRSASRRGGARAVRNYGDLPRALLDVDLASVAAVETQMGEVQKQLKKIADLQAQVQSLDAKITAIQTVVEDLKETNEV